MSYFEAHNKCQTKMQASEQDEALNILQCSENGHAEHELV